jgi:hypothetical protein
MLGGVMLKLQQSRLRILLVVLLCFLYGHSLTSDDASALAREQIKQFLLTAKVIHRRSSEKGINATQRLTLSDGTITHDALNFGPTVTTDRCAVRLIGVRVSGAIGV